VNSVGSFLKYLLIDLVTYRIEMPISKIYQSDLAFSKNDSARVHKAMNNISPRKTNCHDSRSEGSSQGEKSLHLGRELEADISTSPPKTKQAGTAHRIRSGTPPAAACGARS